VLTEGLVSTLVSSDCVEALASLLDRPDIDCDVVTDVTRYVLSHKNPLMTDLIAKVVLHPACPPGLLTEIYLHAGTRKRAIFDRVKIPEELQRLIASEGNDRERCNLLKHSSILEDLKPTLVDSLLKSDEFEFVTAAVVCGNLKRETLLTLAHSSSLTVAAAACDRIADFASELRLKQFSRTHFGYSYTKLNSFLNAQIDKGTLRSRVLK